MSPQPGSSSLPVAESLPSAGSASDEQRNKSDALYPGTEFPLELVEELWSSAGAKIVDLTVPEFAVCLGRTGERLNFGEPSGGRADAEKQAAFLRSLRLGELALATACVLGRDNAWIWFLDTYRAPLTQAAVSITRSASLGLELADSLYAELYGLRSADAESVLDVEAERQRLSPLASYSGRGSLLGWLRATLAQRHVDYHRRTRRETPLGELDVAAVEPVALPDHLIYLNHAVVRSLRSLNPESRYILSSYFLDQRTLKEIGRILNVHEATISRKIKSLCNDLRDELLRNLQAAGLSHRAAEEALGIDPRDLEINLRWLLQSSQAPSFSEVASRPDKRRDTEPDES